MSDHPRSILITGASSGIGAALVSANRSRTPFLVDRINQPWGVPRLEDAQ